MLANILVTIFVCGFFGTFAFGHVLLITAIWPQLLPGRRGPGVDPAATPRPSLRRWWEQGKNPVARAVGIMLIAALAVASMPARQVAGTEQENAHAAEIAHSEGGMASQPVFRIENYGFMLTGP